MRAARHAVVPIAFLALGTTACAPTILTSYVADVPFLRAHNELTESQRVVGPPRTNARYTLAANPLRVVCQTETSSPTQSVEGAYFDGAQRLVVGFLAVGVGTGGVMLLREGAQGHGAGFVIGGSLLLADALFGLGFAIFAPTQSTTALRNGRTVPVRHGNCPNGLTVIAGGQSLPVDPWGHVPGAAAPARIVVDFGASVSFGGRVAAWFPSPQEKCALARESQHPNASSICGVAPSAPLPLPPPPTGPNGQGWPTGVQWNGSVGFP